MPEETKKQGKGKNDPKEQRKRRGRNAGPNEKKSAESEPVKPVVKAEEKPENPVNEPPSEFYKNLKRETDEILKITEEANAKYKKKEILSNWAKYEMPIESYDEIDEQENLGADYETLANAPLTVGGHFQFKHEKSWDTNTGPSLYDKYFDINMESLNIALCTIPFYERNGIEETVFSESDIQNMNHRATKFKQKYFKDEKYKTPEMEAQDKILKKLIQAEDKDDNNDVSNEKEIDFSSSSNDTKKDLPNSPETDSNQINAKTSDTAEKKDFVVMGCKTESETDKIIKDNNLSKNIKSANDDNIQNIERKLSSIPGEDHMYELIKDDIKLPSREDIKAQEKKMSKNVSSQDGVEGNNESVPQKDVKNPVIESPEDLEKWLDDFLDG